MQSAWGLLSIVFIKKFKLAVSDSDSSGHARGGRLQCCSMRAYWDALTAGQLLFVRQKRTGYPANSGTGERK